MLALRSVDVASHRRPKGSGSARWAGTPIPPAAPRAAYAAACPGRSPAAHGGRSWFQPATASASADGAQLRPSQKPTRRSHAASRRASPMHRRGYAGSAMSHHWHGSPTPICARGARGRLGEVTAARGASPSSSPTSTSAREVSPASRARLLGDCGSDAQRAELLVASALPLLGGDGGCAGSGVDGTSSASMRRWCRAERSALRRCSALRPARGALFAAARAAAACCAAASACAGLAAAATWAVRATRSVRPPRCHVVTVRVNV